ncbi:MAG: hypothetical protein FWG20_03420 [Candidatus Cloacimonetes bacterium]|nr:hypothetical protein [Candidatus Cloacimonadota bacterium]
MGTQQILMIVLSVIVVGAAVAVGIQMFDNQSKNQTKAAVTADLIQFGVAAQAYWRTPSLMGGANNEFNPSTDLAQMMSFINGGVPASDISTPNGTYTFTPNVNGVDIFLDPIPAIAGWVGVARIAFDARTIAPFERGVWSFVGPKDGQPAPPNY